MAKIEIENLQAGGNTPANPPGNGADAPFPWTDFLALLEKQEVIPVIGSEIYLVDDTPLYDLIARRIDVRISTDKHLFHKAAGIYLASGANPDYPGLNATVKEVVAGYPLATFEWINLIANISKFKIYINTTYDNILERALRKAGRAVKKVNYMPWSRDMKVLVDFDVHLKKDNGVILFNAFGTFDDSRPCYSENDLIESVNSLTVDMKADSAFFTKVAQSSNLFLGCTYKNWLMRFVSWSVPARPFAPLLAPPKRFITRNIVRDDYDDTDLISFFKSRLGYETFLLGSTKQFLTDLAAQMVRSTPDDALSTVKAKGWFADNHNCFINFDGAQRNVAEQLFALLETEVRPWLDKKSREPGEPVSKTIKDKILYTNVFIAVVTPSYDGDKSYQGREINWLENYSESDRIGDDKIKVMTIAIGDVKRNKLPAILKTEFWLELPDENLANPDVAADLTTFLNNVKKHS